MLVFVDCEAYGESPVTGRLTEFGAVAYPALHTFHGVLIDSRPQERREVVPERRDDIAESTYLRREREVFSEFDAWITSVVRERPVFVSDNVAFDWQWINCGFWRGIGNNPFGHSGRRISDFYAGLMNEWRNTQSWKRLRVTPHDHNPVHDALGNAEAYRRIMNGER